jgi:hypothetical protein
VYGDTGIKLENLQVAMFYIKIKIRNDRLLKEFSENREYLYFKSSCSEITGYDLNYLKKHTTRSLSLISLLLLEVCKEPTSAKVEFLEKKLDNFANMRIAGFCIFSRRYFPPKQHF